MITFLVGFASGVILLPFVAALLILRFEDHDGVVEQPDDFGSR